MSNKHIKLSNIVVDMAEYTRNSKFTVEKDIIGNVSITSEEDDSVEFYLQDYEADSFTNEVDKLYNDSQLTTYEDCMYCVAKQYIDCL